MQNYPRLFIKAGLIYAMIGALLGIAISINPSLSHPLRFIHIHLNLLGFMTMMVAGVAYHVLPRFSARTLPWPGGMKVQFILQNVGLLGMVAVQGFGSWRGGEHQPVFVFFALRAILEPNLARVNFILIRFLRSGAAKHCAGLLTTRLLRLPDTQRNLRTTLLPRFAHVIPSVSSANIILYLY